MASTWKKCGMYTLEQVKKISLRLDKAGQQGQERCRDAAQIEHFNAQHSEQTDRFGASVQSRRSTHRGG